VNTWLPSDGMVERLRVILAKQSGRRVETAEAAATAAALLGYYDLLSRSYRSSELALSERKK
jgi:hypothetical protein